MRPVEGIKWIGLKGIAMGLRHLAGGEQSV